MPQIKNGMHVRRLRLLTGLSIVGLGMLGCSDDNKTTANADAGSQTDARVDVDTDTDAGETEDLDAGETDTRDAGDADSGSDCVENPKTSDEIMNACTDAEKVDKTPNLPLLLPDGGLPPLP